MKIKQISWKTNDSALTTITVVGDDDTTTNHLLQFASNEDASLFGQLMRQSYDLGVSKKPSRQISRNVPSRRYYSDKPSEMNSFAEALGVGLAACFATDLLDIF